MSQQRRDDLKDLESLLKDHVSYLTGNEVEAFASMRMDLQLGRFQNLTPKQREWVKNRLEYFEPQYLNLVSEGKVPRGREVPTPEVLKNLPKRPPPRKVAAD